MPTTTRFAIRWPAQPRSLSSLASRWLLVCPLVLALGCNALQEQRQRLATAPRFEQEVVPAAPQPHQSSSAIAAATAAHQQDDAAVVAAAYHQSMMRASASCSTCGQPCGGMCGSLAGAVGEPVFGAGCAGCNTSCAACSTANCTGASPSPPNAQEYIFDGGDQQPQVVVRQDWTAAGVDPSDTVIYYETLGGQVCVQPSNRVPIYAPRFGTVRQVTGLVLARRTVGTERMLAPVTPVGMLDTNRAGNMSRPVAPHGEQQVNMLDAFQEHQGGIPIAQTVPPMRFSDAQRPFENITFFTTGIMLDEEIPVLGRILANARSWSNPESVAVEIQGEQAALVVDSKRAQDIHVYEMPDKCAMRICKAASQSIANSGDILRFTIRFDNVGTKPLGNAVVLDSLVSRLEYIEGSQQCSVGANFSSEPNDVGSQVLRWEMENPIEAGAGGVISFDCRVR